MVGGLDRVVLPRANAAATALLALAAQRMGADANLSAVGVWQIGILRCRLRRAPLGGGVCQATLLQLVVLLSGT